MSLCSFEKNVEKHKTKQQKILPVCQLADSWLLKNEQNKGKRGRVGGVSLGIH